MEVYKKVRNEIREEAGVMPPWIGDHTIGPTFSAAGAEGVGGATRHRLGETLM